MRLFLHFTLLIIAFFANIENKTDGLQNFLSSEFGITINTDTKIIFHTKKDIEEEFRRTSISKENLEKIMRAQWSTSENSFIDSLYCLDDKGLLHGHFLDFKGDRHGGYTAGFYVHGEKDSTWTMKISDNYRKIERYAVGKKHGVWESLYANGRRGYKKNYHYDVLVDTSFQWWPNGNIMEMGVYENGKIILKKCFTENTEREMECY